MLDFSAQEKMLKAALLLARSCDVKSPCVFGGGTALSVYYWRHRFSTDIDIFIYIDGAEKALHKMRPTNWDTDTKEWLRKIGYGDDYKESGSCFPGHYLELAINPEEKIQFFETRAYTGIPYKEVLVLGQKTLIEPVEEIIAKKLFYRAHKANARDLFDIALAVHRDPGLLSTILQGGRVTLEHIMILQAALDQIVENADARELYRHEIELMRPDREYAVLAQNAPAYLHDFTFSFISLHGELDADELTTLEEVCFKDAAQSALLEIIEERNCTPRDDLSELL